MNTFKKNQLEINEQSTVGLKGKHGKKNVAAVLSMGLFEDNLP